MTLPVEKASAFVYMSLELLIDSGLATPEQLAEYEVAEAARKAAYKAIPWRRRVSIRWAMWRSHMRHRLHDWVFPEYRSDDD